MKKVDMHEFLADYVEDEELVNGAKITVEIYGRNICEVEVERDDDSIDFKVKRIY